MSQQSDGFFRSEDMSLLQLYIPSEISHRTFSELGTLSLLEFRDLNPEVPPFQRYYTKDIRRLDELETKIIFLIEESQRMNLTLTEPIITESINTVLSETTLGTPELSLPDYNVATLKTYPVFQDIIEMTNIIEETSRKIQELNGNVAKIVRNRSELIEFKYVLKEAADFFEQLDPSQLPENDSQPEDLEEVRHDQLIGNFLGSLNLGFITGVIESSKIHLLESILWRALRGNLVMKTMEIEEKIPEGEIEVEKTVFIVSVHGKETVKKVKKISESIGANLYALETESQSIHGYRIAASRKTTRIEEFCTVLYNTKLVKSEELSRLSESLYYWLLRIRKEKLVYDSLNKCSYDSNRKCIIAEVWVSRRNISRIQDTLQYVSLKSSSVGGILHEIPTSLEKPTSYLTNPFTLAYQHMVDAYGISSYQEVNPSLFSIISFPFLFAVMFGDFGHGLIISIFAFILIRSNFKPNGEIAKMLYNGRYLLLLMGLFSSYTGLIYNDCFSKAISLFPSAFTFTSTGTIYNSNYVYPFGIDPSWIGSSNALPFLNSFKMKQAILLGLFQMLFGIILSAFNFVHFNDYHGLIGVFLPQFIFMNCIFGYLGFLIIFKWCIQNNLSPSILDILIDFVISPFSFNEKNRLYSGQQFIQPILLIIALLCIPIMLLFKPLMKRRSNPNFDFSGEMVHSSIHTIEFVLGSVSNTASYLRLWALSLAHAQLSEVLFDMVLEPGSSNFFMAFICFSFWFILTLSILIIMEGLSAFLHTLRLHWVEFNNKFFIGGGNPFLPFTYNHLSTDLHPIED